MGYSARLRKSDFFRKKRDMKARKIVSGATAVALALAGVLVYGSAASADEDLAPPPTESVEVVDSTGRTGR